MQCAPRSKLSRCGLKHVNSGSDVNGFRVYFRLLVGYQICLHLIVIFFFDEY